MTLELAIAVLWMGGNLLICVYADRARNWRLIVGFYAVWFTGVFVLPDGGIQWFWHAVWLAVAIQSGRQLVRMQEAANASRATQ